MNCSGLVGCESQAIGSYVNEGGALKPGKRQEFTRPDLDENRGPSLTTIAVSVGCGAMQQT